MNNIDWKNLRPLNGSQHESFEELICQLAAYENPPSDSEFLRLGSPDAGVECYWELPSGEKWGWQAKFFRSPPGDSQWEQIDKSVKTTLEKRPEVKKYFVCLPIDRQDPQIDKQEWFMDVWKVHKKKWKKWAEEKDISMEFNYWGRHEVLERLSAEEHRGRYYFWFNKELFSSNWFAQRFEEARADVGSRYKPEVNVELPISQLFNALGRDEKFFDRIEKLVDKAREKWGTLNSFPSTVQDELKGVGESLRELSAFVDSSKNIVGAINWEGARGKLNSVVSSTDNSIADIEDRLKNRDAEKDERTDKGSSTTPEVKELKSQRYRLDQFQRSLKELEDIFKSKSVKLSNTPALLLYGDAGTGKTHLFCDIAERRLDSDKPTVLLLGEQFIKDEPWTQIIKLLGLSCTKEEFLGALNAAAEVRGKKALILIDAINEGEGKYIWKDHLGGLLTTLERYDHIGIAFSVRSTYKTHLVPDDISSNKLIEAEHSGFKGEEFQATKTYFDYYGIQRPNVPILRPEFQNPLFVRLLCEGLEEGGYSRLPDGLQGISEMFDFLINQINKKLSGSEFVGYNKKINKVQEALESFAEKIAQRDENWLPVKEAMDQINSFTPSKDWQSSLYKHLISEGILSEDQFLSYDAEADETKYKEGTRFTYDRLGDHLMAQFLLDNYLNKNDIEESFKKGEPLGNVLNDPNFGDSGVIDALAIQLPEEVGKEITELASESEDNQIIQQALVESVLWRDKNSFSDKTFEQLKEHALKYEQEFRRFLDILLMTAPAPEHPYNADFLNDKLSQHPLNKRDSLWSTFLFDEYSRDSSAVNRLLDWAWNLDDIDQFEEESVRLAAITLSWYLTTSHRFLRDRATKALIKLLESKPNILVEIFEKFNDVNDPYVKERLYAIGYGCAMRTYESSTLNKLADKSYELVFSDNNPPVNILTRDYAKGIIERARRFGGADDYDMDKVRPPYESEWPDNLPDLDKLESKYEEKGTKHEGGLWRIFLSVTNDDFARYVIGTNSHSFQWTAEKLDKPEKLSYEKRLEDFKSSLNNNQIKLLEDIEEMNEQLSLSDVLGQLQEELGEDFDNSEEITDLDVEEHEEEYQEKIESLRRSLTEEEEEVYDEYILPYIENPQIERERNRFDLSLVQSFILDRILKLDYTDDLFKEFDEYASGNYYRSPTKPERIGKKYQWIAYYEALARIADNFKFSGGFFSSKEEGYKGPWQLSYVRNIDPSMVQKDTSTKTSLESSYSWWFNENYDWSEDYNSKKWLEKEDDIPRAGNMLKVTDSSKNSNWLILNGHFAWHEPKEPEEKSGLEGDRRQIFYTVNSYLLPKSKLEESIAWSKNNKFTRDITSPEGPDMPTKISTYCFLGELFCSQCYKSQIPVNEREQGQDNIYQSWIQTAGEFLWERSYDCSGEDSVNIAIPSKELKQGLGLNWGIKSKFVKESGKIIAFDPSFNEPGPSMLLVRESEFLSFLENNDLAIIWLVNGEKLITTSDRDPTKFNERMLISGTYFLNDEQIIEGEMNFQMK